MDNIYDKYNMAMRVMHWLMAIIIILMIISGFFMEKLANDVIYKWDMYKIHKSFGVIVIVLFFIRLVLRLSSKIPDLPNNIFPNYIKIISNMTYFLLYTLMLMVPISGVMMSSLGGHDIPLFNYTLPKFFDINKQLATIFHNSHWILAYTMLSLILVHFLGTLKHIFIDKYNILKRIV